MAAEAVPDQKRDDGEKGAGKEREERSRDGKQHALEEVEALKGKAKKAAAGGARGMDCLRHHFRDLPRVDRIQFDG